MARFRDSVRVREITIGRHEVGSWLAGWSGVEWTFFGDGSGDVTVVVGVDFGLFNVPVGVECRHGDRCRGAYNTTSS